MNRRFALAAAAALTAPLLLTPAAHATVDPGDEAQSTLVVKVGDKVGDVRVDKGLPKALARAGRAADIATVQYLIDRDTRTLTIDTEVVHRVLPKDKRYHEWFATGIYDPQTARAVMVITDSWTRSKVHVVDADESDHGLGPVCKDATVEVLGGVLVRQIVPFSCLNGVVDHGRIRSVIGVERTGGADLGWDYSKPTRDLPLDPVATP